MPSMVMFSSLSAFLPFICMPSSDELNESMSLAVNLPMMRTASGVVS